jgi:hypothetical protein
MDLGGKEARVDCARENKVSYSCGKHEKVIGTTRSSTIVHYHPE